MMDTWAVLRGKATASGRAEAIQASPELARRVAESKRRMPAGKRRERGRSRRLIGVVGWPVPGTPRGRLGFVRAGGMVVECFFLSNPADLAAYQSNKDVVAAVIAAVLAGG